MKKLRMATILAAAFALTVGAAFASFGAETAGTIHVVNSYDTDQTSSDDNDDEKIHPLAPSIYSEDYDIIAGPEWSKDVVNWKAGSNVTGTIYINMDDSSAEALGKKRTEIVVDGADNEVELTSVERYSGSRFQEDYPDATIYKVKFKYQVVVQLGDTSWAGWDSANPTQARWNGVKYGGTYRVTLFDSHGSVVTQKVQGATSYDFSQWMTTPGETYYYEVTAISANGDQQDYTEDGSQVRSESVVMADPGITEGRFGDFQKGRRFLKKDGTSPTNGWYKIFGKWYYCDSEGYVLTGWQTIGGKQYYFYEDGSMAAGTTTPDGSKVGADGAKIG